MECLSIAVIGAYGVGKTHFIRTAMSLPPPSKPQAPPADPKTMTARIVVDNVPYSVALFELDLQYFESEYFDGQHRQVKWPKQMNGTILPQVHGVLFLYDVMNRESINYLPETLNAVVNSSLPAVLVATKCDNPEPSRQIDADAVAAACKPCLASFKTSTDKPETARMALSTLLRAMILGTHENESTEATGLRRRATSEVTHLDAPTESLSRPISQHSKHSRASSDMSLLRGYLNAQENTDYRHSRVPRVDLLGGQISDEYESVQTVHSQLRSPGVRLDRAQHIFVEIEDSDGESMRYSDDIPLLQRTDENLFDRSAKKPGLTFDELVDRLLAPKLSRVDHNFAGVFLCLYRKFATPGELFSAILARLDAIKDDKSIHYLTKTTTQLRIIEAIAKWVETYPNDFARSVIRRRLDEFITHLAAEPIFSAAALQMRKILEESVTEDDDTGWVKSEAEDSQADKSSSENARQGSDVQDSLSLLSIGNQTDRHASAASLVSSSAGAATTKTHSFQFHSYEDYEREAVTMTPTYTLPLTKFRYHIFLDMVNDDIADEMTRIDWVMFSSIRIRDLVRHVSLSAEQKEKCKAMRNVNRMISHFNHVATWVSNMVLMRDKAKHRAVMLEKFMHIALRLRQLNNYNGLAAVLAGINGTAVLRLTQTRALVPPDVQKRFARLVLLMGTQKGYFAYRLAWENSPLPRIPFIPLHRKDLVSAEEGSITFIGPQGDRLNWKKFEVLGEVILPIMKSQSTPYPNLTKHDDARELILDCLITTDEDDIYQRSTQVESSSGLAVDPSKKKFPWFANKIS
ncbi:ras guanine nucleotide exchange factor domain-containing protein [Xylaria bambusicola]|uniref:ras guanine nucleotide exchange factor domain-containing protein n=1 Tax=Xylaria bambusicola TaxID=326684 RepID=UPI002007FA1C|nr:ras guanine nucleotide exchange factor domain-containing protein [Xylaria bambusicola]KAI0518219.1 ras guanine nucleotide exchange factor domain-containing protein [Xylaria bambusicola]